MRILLLATTYNSLTQRAHVELISLGHDVSVELAVSDEVIAEAVALCRPDLIIAPMLKTAILEHIWRNHICIIIHPGIKGDRGPSSLDWAIMTDAQEWGVTALQAVAEMDAGPIWSSFNFKMRQARKSSLYRHEVTEAAMQAILQTVLRFESRVFVPEPLDYSRADVKGSLRPFMKQESRTIDWSEPTSCILKKIHAADSCPGVLDTIYGEKYYLYGAQEEDTLKGTPSEIIAQRQGAICRATGDGAIWISHLKQKKTAEQSFFKLPAAMVLDEHLKDVSEYSLELQVPATRKTYREIWYEEQNDVGYLHFEFYNGAMSTEQCHRLKEAFIYARKRPTKVIVLMGGADFWSNGIHLNTIEAASNPADESWRNINAMNDLIYEIITTDTHLTISAMEGNAGAGGVMLAIAADFVYARTGVVLNPHYKGMGNLYGSEYWTYLLPKRVGYEKAMELTNNCLPVGTQLAKQIGLIDNYFGNIFLSFRQCIVIIAEAIIRDPDYEQRLARKNKVRLLDEQIKPLANYRAEELERMKVNFYGSDRSYHIARSNFVYKVSLSETPLHLTKHKALVAV
jgi:putative two-component system hydrogenase maturation factor HypX/HoxX